MESKLVISIPTKCNLCVWERNCHKDARDPDCYPYVMGCEEFSNKFQIVKDFFAVPSEEVMTFAKTDTVGFDKLAQEVVMMATLA